jgi:TM2 domain-containing membrane protein YozV/rubrerythrin
MATKEEWQEAFELINDCEPTLAEYETALANGEISENLSSKQTSAQENSVQQKLNHLLETGSQAPAFCPNCKTDIVASGARKLCFTCEKKIPEIAPEGVETISHYYLRTKSQKAKKLLDPQWVQEVWDIWNIEEQGKLKLQQEQVKQEALSPAFCAVCGNSVVGFAGQNCPACGTSVPLVAAEGTLSVGEARTQGLVAQNTSSVSGQVINRVNIPVGYEQKSKITAGILGILLGGFGAHNFYLGNTQRAIIQLLMMIGGWILTIILIGAFISMAAGIWGLVEGIMILTGSINKDAKGIPLKD